MNGPLEQLINRLLQSAMEVDAGDPKRVHHLLKVLGFARSIALEEGLDENSRLILEAAAVLHDIGIHLCEEKYASCGGRYQEREGPAIAREILDQQAPELSPETKDRICVLIGRHHTYTHVDGLDCRILLEADFLVNMLEDRMGAGQIAAGRDLIFRTPTGLRYLALLTPSSERSDQPC